VLDNIYRLGKGDALTWWFYLCCDMRRKGVIRKVPLGGIEESMIWLQNCAAQGGRHEAFR
jgi:hypothetical protein